MARDVFVYDHLFAGKASPPATASADGTAWTKADTSAAGSPTVTNSANGMLITLDNTNEVQNVCLYHGDILMFDIDDLLEFSFWASIQTALGAASDLAFGLCSARNDAIDSLTAHASFRCLGNSTILVESDDGSTDKDDISTGGLTLATTTKKFTIDFSNGKSDVRFLIGDANGNMQRVAKSTTFDMSAYSSGLQPYMQVQKTASTNLGACALRRVRGVFRVN